MQKRKYTIEQKLEVCKDKEINNLSNAQLSLKYGIPKTNIRDWTKIYSELGEEAFKQIQDRKNNHSYTADFRIALVHEKLNSNIRNAIGVTTAPTKSKRLWARNPSVFDVLKSITFLKPPLV